jgi:hypothetical protein
MSEKIDKPRENRLRRQATAMFYRLRKSNIALGTIANMGLYRITDPELHTIEAGVKYDLTLDDVEKFLRG